MKWFKLITNIMDDEPVAAFLEEAGTEGFGFYVGTMSIVKWTPLVE